MTEKKLPHVLLRKLQSKPQYFKSIISGIEKSYGYENKYSFEEDFNSLVDESNWSNCYLIFEKKVKGKDLLIGHIGSLPRSINVNDSSYKCILIGGIYLSHPYRGKGIFGNVFMTYLKKIEKEYDYALLWSEKEHLYQRFGFHRASECKLRVIDSCSKSELLNLGYEHISLNLLTRDEKKNQIKSLYKFSIEEKFTTPLRTTQHWDFLFKSKSINLLIKRKNKKIVCYCLIGKGFDYQNIIHEWAVHKNFKKESKYFYGLSTIIYDQNNTENEQDIIIPSALILPFSKKKELLHEIQKKPLYISGADSI